MNKASKALGTCEVHQKLLYMTRKLARQVANQHHPSKSVYHCSVMPQFWHVGGLSREIKQGAVGREVYRRNSA